MRRAIHRLHPGQVVLLWGLTVLGLWAFNAGRLDPALGVEEVRALETFADTGPTALDADSLADLVAIREDARAAMAKRIADDSIALLAAMTGGVRPDGAFEPPADAPPEALAEPLELPAASPAGHFVYVTPVIDSTWPWPRTIPSRVRQRAVAGEAERVRTELDTYREATGAWSSGRAKLQRSRVVKGGALLLFLLTVGVTWSWFGRPARSDSALAGANATAGGAV